MRLIRKLKTYLASLVLISFVAPAYANPGKYTQVDKGSTVPFSGYCFDHVASAHILANREIKEQWCKDKTDKSLAAQKAAFELEIGKLISENEYQKTANIKTIEALKEENLNIKSGFHHYFQMKCSLFFFDL